MIRFATVLLGALLLSAPANAVEPDEMLADPALEQRARDLSKGLRCLVCQNESIDDSSAGLARDLRLLVRERLSAGDSDREVLDFVTARYGDFVLLRPPVKAYTLALWLGPFIVLLIGAGSLAVWYRRRAAAAAVEAPAPLSDAERDRLRRLMDRDEKDGKS